MKKLSQLFYECAFLNNWTTINDVDFKFIEYDNTLEIYFQGSNQVTDWIDDFLFSKRPYKNMDVSFRVHRGFLKQWKQIEDIIIEKIKNPKYKEIVIIGYSLGGALAWFCHECCWYYRPDIRNNIYGFGFEAPRVYACLYIKPQLKERWDNFLVIRDNNDIVTHCPPIIFGYRHTSKILKIKGDTSLVENKWIPKCIKSHYPQVVLDGLMKYENESNKTTK